MPEPDFDGLRQSLMQAGIAPRHARRTILELEEHFADLKEELMAQGFGRRRAEMEASRQLGSLEAIGEIVASRSELRCWPFRYPRVARIVLPIAYALLIPATPLIVGVGYAPVIARWGVIVSLSAIITAAMFWLIQVSISLG